MYAVTSNIPAALSSVGSQSEICIKPLFTLEGLLMKGLQIKAGALIPPSHKLPFC